MSNPAKAAAKRFLRKYRLTRIDSKTLQAVLNHGDRPFKFVKHIRSRKI